MPAPGEPVAPGVVLSVPLVPGPAPVPEDGGGVVLGVSDGGVVVAGALLVPVLLDVPVPCSPLLSPLLQAVTLIVSRPSSSRILEACSVGFIALPFN